MSELTFVIQHPQEAVEKINILRERAEKTVEQERFIWWVHQVYAKNVQDLIVEIISACTYQDEPTAVSGSYGLPLKCFEHMERISKYSHAICDGTYLDVETSKSEKSRKSDPMRGEK